jgi:hypothetical protein
MSPSPFMVECVAQRKSRLKTNYSLYGAELVSPPIQGTADGVKTPYDLGPNIG